MSSRRGSQTLRVESGLLLAVTTAGASNPDGGTRHLLRRVSQLLQGRRRHGSDGRATAFRPTAEGLESKMLLSDVLGWGGGNGGNPNSLITPANISTLKKQYSVKLDGAILAAPVSAAVDVTVGPNPGTQTLVFVATESDSLYAFNTGSGELEWKTSFLKPGETPLPKGLTRSSEDGITSTPVIDPSTNTIYVVTTESYVAASINHFSVTLHAVDMSNGLEMPGSPAVIADTGYKGTKAVSFKDPSGLAPAPVAWEGGITFTRLNSYNAQVSRLTAITW